MLSQRRLTITAKAAAGIGLALLAFTACQNPKPAPPKPAPPPTFSEIYDRDINEVLQLAKENRWEEAQARANALFNQDPKNPILGRLHTWVDQAAQQRRQQALEDKIRSIDAKNSVFNPNLKDVVTEQKDRGLPARKDVRDAVDAIENSPYIPDSYGKTLHEPAPIFDIESSKGRMSKVLEKKVSIHLENVPLESILINLSQTAGINIAADKSLEALKKMVIIHFDSVTLKEVLLYIERNYDLQFQVGDEVVWVVDAKDGKHLFELTRVFQLRKGLLLPATYDTPESTRTTLQTAPNVSTTTEVQKFNRFVSDQTPLMPAIERAITNLYTGRYFIDYEHNQIVARGTPEQLDVMEHLIRDFDRPIQQVFIEARFVTISKPAFLQLGILWQTTQNVPSMIIPQDFTGLINNQNFPQAVNPISGSVSPAVGIGIQNTFTTVFGAQDLQATISAMEQSGESQTLSAPRLTILNNRPASIHDGKVQYYYEEYSVVPQVGQYYSSSFFVPSGKPTKITAGAILNVMASISADGKGILLALNPVVNTDVSLVKYATLSQYGANGNLQSTFDINLPQYRTEEIQTRATVKSGQTVVMGGVLEREKSTYVESVPVLGDIPYLGALFRRRTEIDTPRYLLIFVTATIVKDSGEFLVYDEQAPTTNTVAPPK
jgi:type IV pilus assembly protein PilQ